LPALFFVLFFFAAFFFVAIALTPLSLNSENAASAYAKRECV